MVDLPHRFVPTSSRFVSPVRIVPQCGHDTAICSVAFSPYSQYFASADNDGRVKIWVLETLDILGTYLLDFVCTELEWDNLNAVICRGNGHERRIELPESEAPADVLPPIDPSRVIRLIGAPEAAFENDTVTVSYNDETYTHELPGLLGGQMDPCERFAVGFSPEVILAVSVFNDDELMRIPCEGFPQNSWRAMRISDRGAFFVGVSSNGSIWKFDALKNTNKCLLKGATEVTSIGFGGDRYIIYGNTSGNITIYDLEDDCVLLRTPRSPRHFDAVYPSPEKIGFIALRPESATAFFGYSQEILSASPLPGACLASCPGSVFSEVFVACSDRAVYRLKLDENDIAKVCSVAEDDTVDAMGASGSLLLIHYASGRIALHNAVRFLDVAFENTATPRAVSVSESAKIAALLIGDQIRVLDLSGKTPARTFDAPNVAQIILGKEKTAGSLMLFRRDLSIAALDLATGTITEISTIDAPNARVISIAPAAKAFVFVLLEIEHGQLGVYKVGLNTGKSSLALRIYAQGMQIWAASTSEQTVNFRNDATCLRIISGLRAFSVEDWSRSEPLAIF